jgi:hypothetical protein
MPQVPAPRRRSADLVNDIRQQRKKKVGGVTDVLKTPAACREIDLHSSLAKMLDDFIGGRNIGFLIQTENSTMLSPENFFRDGFESVFEEMERTPQGLLQYRARYPKVKSRA